MILDISEQEFRQIFNDNFFSLPIRWDGMDFLNTLKELYSRYIDRLKCVLPGKDIKEIEQVTSLLSKTIKDYYSGFPHEAFLTFPNVMKILDKERLITYEKSFKGDFKRYRLNGGRDPLTLFRVRKIEEGKLFSRKDLFHVPYNKRSIVSTNRYSMAFCFFLQYRFDSVQRRRSVMD